MLFYIGHIHSCVFEWKFRRLRFRQKYPWPTSYNDINFHPKLTAIMDRRHGNFSEGDLCQPPSLSPLLQGETEKVYSGNRQQSDSKDDLRQGEYSFGKLGWRVDFDRSVLGVRCANQNDRNTPPSSVESIVVSQIVDSGLVWAGRRL